MVFSTKFLSQESNQLFSQLLREGLDMKDYLGFILAINLVILFDLSGI